MVPAADRSKTSSTDNGKYRFLLPLGEGGTANILLAVAQGPSGFNKLVVLKTMKRHIAEDPEFRRMFLNEARLAARLNHANVVQTYEIAEHNGSPIIVMEYLEGQPLSKVAARAGKRLVLAMHLRIIADALRGLHCAHELKDFDGTRLNVVHRDMSPHNVIVTHDGHVKLVDFGIAKLDRSDIRTSTGVIKGKLRYMSPEQLTGEPIDRRADIYSVGVMLWEAATGVRMWRDENDPAIMYRVVNGDIPSPREANPGVSPELERICMKALAPDRGLRYATAMDLEADVEAEIRRLDRVVTSREIAGLMTDLFEEQRIETRSKVEERLRTVASLSAAEVQELESSSSALQALHSPNTRSTTVTVVAPRSRVASAALGAAGTVLVGLLVWLMVKWRAPTFMVASPDAPAAAAPAPAAPEATAPVPPVETAPTEAVSMTASTGAVPATAPTGAVPATAPAGAVPATAPAGAVPATTSTGAAPATAPTGAAGVKAAAAPPEPAVPRSNHPPPGPDEKPEPAISPSAAPSAPPSANCKPPYYFDDRGIKKYKPECL
ncbi:serine/threonine-protein kinase [Sorangium sp. So ce1036]|uniref:serine/threonine protein kinase n=1 Tax=Sorangium sp. So ce1036 TaxID=3133328 RepID=UPI003F085BDD